MSLLNNESDNVNNSASVTFDSLSRDPCAWTCGLFVVLVITGGGFEKKLTGLSVGICGLTFHAFGTAGVDDVGIPGCPGCCGRPVTLGKGGNSSFIVDLVGADGIWALCGGVGGKFCFGVTGCCGMAALAVDVGIGNWVDDVTITDGGVTAFIVVGSAFTVVGSAVEDVTTAGFFVVVVLVELVVTGCLVVVELVVLLSLSLSLFPLKNPEIPLKNPFFLVVASGASVDVVVVVGVVRIGGNGLKSESE